MTEQLKQIAKEEIIKLPKEMQETINAFDWVKITEEIGKKYLLTESEINDLQVETLLVLVGLENADYYAQNVENEIGTSKNEAIKIAEEANQKIFTPIANTIEENIKKNLKNKNPNWSQNVDFVMSGGDYSAFMEERGNATPAPIDTQNPSKQPFSRVGINTPARSASSTAGAGGPTNTKRMTDIKSKFTI